MRPDDRAIAGCYQLCASVGQGDPAAPLLHQVPQAHPDHRAVINVDPVAVGPFGRPADQNVRQPRALGARHPRIADPGLGQQYAVDSPLCDEAPEANRLASHPRATGAGHSRDPRRPRPRRRASPTDRWSDDGDRPGGMTNPKVCIEPRLSACAAAFGTKPASCMTLSMRSRVGWLMGRLPERAYDTVLRDTPASSAMRPISTALLITLVNGIVVEVTADRPAHRRCLTLARARRLPRASSSHRRAEWVDHRAEALGPGRAKAHRVAWSCRRRPATSSLCTGPDVTRTPEGNHSL